MSAPVFVVPLDVARSAAAGSTVLLDGAEGRHAAVVRRLAAGEDVDLTDGAGVLLHSVVESAGRDGLVCRVLVRTRTPEPQPRLVVVQALAKGDRGELAVETCTEVGVDEIVPWAAARSITRWRGERADKALAKWRGAAREAAKQSRRSIHPVVSRPASTREVADRLRAADLRLVLHEAAGESLGDVDVPGLGEVVLVVGPEGGVAPEELEAFREAGARVVRLGPSVLRTSTAGAVAAGVVLSRTARWS